MDPSHENTKNELMIRPLGIWLFLVFFVLLIGHLLFIVLIHSLDLMPKELASHTFFRSSGFYLNFVGNLIFAFLLLVALYQMRRSALLWSLSLLLFDVCSTSYWILTQNWLENAGYLGVVLISFIWLGSFSCFLYLRYLNNQEMLI